MSKDNVISEITENFKSVILDRFSNPFILSFLISWSIINYRVFLILFSKGTLKHKLDLLEWYFHTPQDYYLYYGILLPLTSSIIYVFIYPFVNRKILRFVLKRKLEEIKDKNELEKSTVFTYSDIEKLLKRHADEINQYKTTISALERSEQILTEQINKMKTVEISEEEEEDGESNNITVSSNSLSSSELAILVELGLAENKGNEGLSERGLSQRCKLNLLDTKLALGSLQETQYISSRYYDSEKLYSLTHQGRVAFRQYKPLD